MSSESQRKRKTRRQRVRAAFRRFRIAVLLLVFALVWIGGYLNYFGLPGFLKRPLLDSLRTRGVNLEFSRLRLRWYRGIVADDVRLLGLSENPALPQLNARSADVRLNYAALARLRIEVDGVTLRGGNLVWQFAPTNELPRELAITNITANLRFLPGDEWSLDHLDARFLDARFHVSGRITNASALRSLPVFQGRSRTPPQAMVRRLRRLQEVLSAVHFRQPPEFRLRVTGDGADRFSFAGDFTIVAPDATTPWGDFEILELSSHLESEHEDAPPSSRISLAAERATTPWGAIRRLHLKADVVQTDTDELQCTVTARAGELTNAIAAGQRVALEARWSQGLDALVPRQGRGRLHADNIRSPWANAAAASLDVEFSPPTNTVPPNPALGAWTPALPIALNLTGSATNLARDGIQLESLAVAGRWEAPRLTLTRLDAALPDGRASAVASLDILTRELQFDAKACFDFQRITPLLTEKSREWFGNFSWQQPPSVAMDGHLILPAWTNRQPDWRREVQPGIVLNGLVHLTNGSYRGITALSASTHLSYSNRVWRLPDLTINRPEGALLVNLQSDEVSHDYLIRLRGPFDFRVLASQLDDKGRRGLGYFEFDGAPWIEGEVGGRWYERDRIHARARVQWTNFSFRAQHADRLSASLLFTNQILHVFQPRIDRGAERATADGLLFDFTANRAWLTNGFTDTDPMAIAAAIGPKVAAAVSNYQFLKPPVARVSGMIPLRGERDADLHFDIEGGPFRWFRFNLPHIAGHVCWANESVTLSNITASFYGGEARGGAWFDVREPGSTPFFFEVCATNSDLHALMSDLRSPTNQLEGTLTARLVISSANTTNWNSWNGHGSASLRNGLIWDSPVFGVMSTVLNSIVPGMGNNRASDATGSCIITNSVIYTRNLDIRASGMRLQYEGTVDFDTRVNARVEAELLRDTWIIGRLVSTVLWPVSKIFQFKVTGTLADPKTEPVYLIPKIFLAPLNPVKTLKDVFPDSPGGTNAPARPAEPARPSPADAPPSSAPGSA